MGTAACGGRGFKGRAVVSGERPMGAHSCRQQHNQASCQPPPPPLVVARVCLLCRGDAMGDTLGGEMVGAGAPDPILWDEGA